MSKYSVETAMRRAQASERSGAHEEARTVYEAILKSYPNNRRAKQALAALISKEGVPANPPHDKLAALQSLYRAGQLSVVADQAAQLAEGFPSSKLVLSILGAASNGLGRLEQAASAFMKASQLDPDCPVTKNNLGSAMHGLGRYEDAATSFQAAVTLKPHYVEAQYNLGLTLAAQQRFPDAEIALRRTIEVEPKHAGAHYDLGLALEAQLRHADAEQSYRQAIDLKPDFVKALNNLGANLSEQGRFEEAAECYRRTLDIVPNHAVAYSNMGLARFRQNQLSAAIECFQSALAQRPDFGEAHLNLGRAFKEQGRFGSAIASCKKALQFMPGNVTALRGLGSACRHGGQFQEALNCYRQVLELQPDNAEIFASIALIYRDLNEPDEAMKSLERAVGIRPDYAAAHRNLSNLKRYKAEDPHFLQMLAIYESDGLHDESLCELCFALAKACEDIGRLEDSYRFLQEGNDLRRKALGFDLRVEQRFFERMRRIDQGAARPLSLGSQTEFAPVFILGMPRSGTTLVEQILSSHSQVQGAGELTFLSNVCAVRIKKNELAEEDIRGIREAYLEEISPLVCGRRFVTDKMPFNFRLIGIITRAFPEAKIIHIERSPSAVCWSNYKHYFSSKGLSFPYNWSDIISYYKLYVAYMKLWNGRYPEQILNLTYEVLTEDQEVQTRRLISHLDLDWEDACLEFHKNERATRTASHQQVRKKMYRGSSEEWRKFEPFLGNALSELDGITL